MRIWIVEDEPWAKERLQSMLLRYDAGIVVEHCFDSVQALSNALTEQAHPQLILSDIELLDGQVFQAYQQHPPSCALIFTTAYQEYLLQAFDSFGIGYLLKPFDDTQLAAALNKFRQLCQPAEQTGALQQALQQLAPATTAYKTRLLVKRVQGMELCWVEQLSCICLQLSGLVAYDRDGHSYPLSESSLSALEQQLDPQHFFRLNRTEMVALAAITKIIPSGKDRLEVRLKGYAEPLVCSAQRTPLFRRWLEG